MTTLPASREGGYILVKESHLKLILDTFNEFCEDPCGTEPHFTRCARMESLVHFYLFHQEEDGIPEHLEKVFGPGGYKFEPQ